MNWFIDRLVVPVLYVPAAAASLVVRVAIAARRRWGR